MSQLQKVTWFEKYTTQEEMLAVLIEAISVVIKAESIVSKYPGGWEQFSRDVPNETLCADGELARIGFMYPNKVHEYVSFLEERNLIYLSDGKCVDIAVLDQQRGFSMHCDWADYGHICLDPAQTQRVSACRLKGSQQRIVSYPNGWEYDNSLSKDYIFVNTSGEEQHLDDRSASCMVAHAYNNLDVSLMEKHLVDNLHYSSQWVLDEIHDKQVYLEYLRGKFNTVHKTGSKIFAELAKYQGQFCLVIAQGSKVNPVATMFVKIKDGKIAGIHMCEVPRFLDCERLGVYP